jgi:hypothetical protein
MGQEQIYFVISFIDLKLLATIGSVPLAVNTSSGLLSIISTCADRTSCGGGCCNV